MQRVLIADGELILREGVKQVVASMTECRIVEEASSVIGAVKLVRQGDIDLLLMASEPSGLGTARLISNLQDSYPKLPILIFGYCDELRQARRALQAGARGYVSARVDIRSIQLAISQVATGGVYVCSEVRDQMIFESRETLHNIDRPHTTLSSRELEIFEMLANGKPLSQIANSLHLSVKTVSTHKSNILVRMNLSSVAELVQYAIAHNLMGRS